MKLSVFCICSVLIGCFVLLEIVVSEENSCIVKIKNGAMTKVGNCQDSPTLNDLMERHTWFKASNGMLYKVFEAKKNYFDSKYECYRYGTALASKGVRNRTTKLEILNAIKPSDSKGKIWIGLEKVNSTHWKWLDGVISHQSNLDWSKGEPNKNEIIENYGDLYNEGKFQLNDEASFVLRMFMCEG